MYMYAYYMYDVHNSASHSSLQPRMSDSNAPQKTKCTCLYNKILTRIIFSIIISSILLLLIWPLYGL